MQLKISTIIATISFLAGAVLGDTEGCYGSGEKWGKIGAASDILMAMQSLCETDIQGNYDIGSMAGPFCTNLGSNRFNTALDIKVGNNCQTHGTLYLDATDCYSLLLSAKAVCDYGGVFTESAGTSGDGYLVTADVTVDPNSGNC